MRGELHLLFSAFWGSFFWPCACEQLEYARSKEALGPGCDVHSIELLLLPLLIVKWNWLKLLWSNCGKHLVVLNASK